MGVAQHRILVVDDEQAILAMVARKLGDCGFECHTAADATTALNLFSSKVFDLILLDILLPDRLGTEILSEVESHGHNTAVILVTWVTASHLLTQARDHGVLDFIIKPFDLSDLATRVQNALQAQRRATEPARRTA